MRKVWVLKDTIWLRWFAVAMAMCFVCAPPIEAQISIVEKGVVVEEVGEGSALEKAGLRPGDVIYAWERLPAPPANPQGAQGTIESVFDWMWLEVEQVPRGTVRLTGQRNGEIKVFEVVPGKWKGTVRARMPEGMLADYARGKELIEVEEIEAGIDLWHKVSGGAESPAAIVPIKCWLLLRIGDAWSKAVQWEKAQDAYGSAFEAAQDSLARVAIWQAIGKAYEKASEFKTAEEAYGSAQEIRERTWGEGLAFASGLSDLGRLAWRQGKLDSSHSHFQRALEIIQKLAPGTLEVAKILHNIGTLAFSKGDLDRSAKYIERSLEIMQKLAPDSIEVALNLNNLGGLALERGDLERSTAYHESALEIRQRLMPGSLGLADSLNNLGMLAYERGDLDRSAEHLEGALEIRRKLAPGSLEVAASLNNLGTLASQHGDLDRATEYHEWALDIKQKLAPGSLGVAMSLNNLGGLALERGDLDQAAECYVEALEIKQKLAPDSLDIAATLNNLGALASERGDLDRAAEYHEWALEINQRLAPDSLGVAMSLNNLGTLNWERGDLDRAAEYIERSLKITQAIAPDSLAVSTNLGNLGVLAADWGDLTLAFEYYEESLKINQKLAPDSLDVAVCLRHLGNLAYKRGDLVRSAEYYERSLAIKKKLAPDSLAVAMGLVNLGILANARDDPGRAAEYYEEALEIQRKLAPGTLVEAEMLFNLARVRRKQNQPQQALALFLQALLALENQVSRLGGTRDIQADFRADRVEYYRGTINLLLKLQHSEEAFHTLERSRARSFLAQFAERDLVFSDIPEELDRRRRQIAWNYNKTQDEISGLNPRDHGEEIEILLTQLRQIRWDRNDVTENIIKSSPKLGALRYPKPLKLDDARKILDPGTVMLSYSIDEDETHLFILTHEGELQVKTIPLGEKALQVEVERILELQKRRSTSHLYKNPIRQAGERLYQALIQPAEDAIVKSDRILIVPDGPLHLLPFALLVRKPAEKTYEAPDFEYLVEWKPLHTTLSATVYASLKNLRRTEPAKLADPTESKDVLALAAFGDPEYSYSDLRSLPHSREEVNRIAALFPEGTARAFLDAESTEEQAKAIGKSARILHFATHGQYDDRFPLNSYLALTIPKEFQKDQDNGKLQAWEIFEGVRLGADLVVLSACESGLGEEVFGEGLKGLTRAFQFAGARTVAASLWKVEDRATAELMVRFYRHLRAGTSKDEALRAAQLELIRGPVEVKNSQGQVVERDLSAPYYWAAFQMIGDWQ